MKPVRLAHEVYGWLIKLLGENCRVQAGFIIDMLLALRIF